MKQSLVKLVDVILKKIEEHPENMPSENGIRAWLHRQGYKKPDIEAAMKLLQRRFYVRREVREYQPSPVRILSAFEERKLSVEARNALARLELYGLIDPYERELILDRLGDVDGEVGLDELDYLLSWLVANVRDVESQRTMYDVLDKREGSYH